jgi:DNA-binding SARP family transcriptional activator
MELRQSHIARLFLPLLAHGEPSVRHQACLILLGLAGDRALSELRRLLDDADLQVRQEARLAMLALAEVMEDKIKLLPFRGMYIACLGQLRVYVGSRELLPADYGQVDGGRAGWQKVQAALAYLIHCGQRGTSRAALGAAVWGGAHTASSLARTLSVLQSALGSVEGALVLGTDFCRLDPECYSTDTQLFERAYAIGVQIEQTHGLAQAEPLYSEAVQVYGGPYMAGVARAESWCRRRRDDLTSSFVIAAERVAEHAYAQRQFRRCLDLCALALDADPTADDVVGWMLRALGQEGRYAELEHSYRMYIHAAGGDRAGGDGVAERVTQIYQDLVRLRVR